MVLGNRVHPSLVVSKEGHSGALHLFAFLIFTKYSVRANNLLFWMLLDRDREVITEHVQRKPLVQAVLAGLSAGVPCQCAVV